MATRVPIPIHLGVYWHGVAERVPGGVNARSACGPYVEELAERVERVTLAAHDPPSTSRYSEGLADYPIRPSRDNVEVLSLGKLGGRGDYLARRRRIAARIGPASQGWDVLVLRFGRRAHLVERANRCPRTAALVWGSTPDRPKGGWLSPWRMWKTLLVLRSEWHLRQVVRGSQLLVSDGEACLSRYRQIAAEVSLIRSSSRRERFAYRTDDRLSGARPRFLSVGHITEEKGIRDVIEAFRRIREATFPDAVLDVVGVGPLLEEIRTLTADLGEAVVFHGWVPAGERLFDLYRRADVLLFLSRSSTESFPRVVSEAMAHSVLVVSTPVGSLPVPFQHDRELVFVPIGRPEIAAQAVAELSVDADRRRALIERGSGWSRQATVEGTIDALLHRFFELWPTLMRADQREGG